MTTSPGREETMTAAIDRLRVAGYTRDFCAQREGLREVSSDRVFPPDELTVDEVVRFEGTTNPADEAILFALRDEQSDTRGTYVVAYGPSVDPIDAEIVRHLEARKRHDQMEGD